MTQQIFFIEATLAVLAQFDGVLQATDDAESFNRFVKERGGKKYAAQRIPGSIRLQRLDFTGRAGGPDVLVSDAPLTADLSGLGLWRALSGVASARQDMSFTLGLSKDLDRFFPENSMPRNRAATWLETVLPNLLQFPNPPQMDIGSVAKFDYQRAMELDGAAWTALRALMLRK